MLPHPSLFVFVHVLYSILSQINFLFHQGIASYLDTRHGRADDCPCCAKDTAHALDLRKRVKMAQLDRDVAALHTLKYGDKEKVFRWEQMNVENVAFAFRVR